METHDELKTYASFSQMSKMLGFSRSRCYQLIEAGILYPPIFDIQTHRPYYPPEIQQKNLEIRKRNCGMNGKPILFYSQRVATEPTPKRNLASKKNSKLQKQNSLTNRLINDLKSLGLDCPNLVHIESAVKLCFPAGINQVEEAEVLRTIYRHLKRQYSSDNIER